MAETDDEADGNDVINVLLASDLASEVRTEFDGKLSVGFDIPSATGHIFARFREGLSNPNDGPVVLLAVAALQVRESYLMPVVKEAVLDLIDSGEALNAYRADDWQLRKQRKSMLESFADRLRETVTTSADSDENTDA